VEKIMRIAQIAPLWERVPPPAYGGIELVVSRLTDELVRRGHEVTLFASGDSQTLARLQSVYPQAFRLNPAGNTDYYTYELLQLSQVYEQAAEFDIIHSHVGCTALPFAQSAKTPTLHTLHGALTPDSLKLFSHYAQQAYISISNAQHQPELNYLATVYNGLDIQDYPFWSRPQEPPYLAFLGRLSPEKGPHHAIAIAKETGWPLKMAGKVDKVDRAFFEQEIAPHIDGKQIQYLGEATHAQKVELLGNAAVTLFPITWQEPFGLVMIESMATGTPVLGMALGSVPEVIAHGKTGFVCQSVAEMVSYLPEALDLDRQACRDHVASSFSVARMVDGYEAAYQKLLGDRVSHNGQPQLTPNLLSTLSLHRRG